MLSTRNLKRLSGWLVFAIVAVVMFMTAERSGSLWDCGEFILAAYKLQVVHPPGAPLFIITARMFTFVADLFSSNPADIGFSVNVMSAICTAFTAAFIAWVTFIFSKISLVGRANPIEGNQALLSAGAAVVAGLTAAFCTSVWFSAVEGEVYAMSTFFTALTLWAMVEWYDMPNEDTNDRWVLFAFFAAALSIGVHLLSLLTFPALALLYYFKKYKEPTLKGAILAMGAGVLMIAFIQKVIIVWVPTIWSWFDLFFVNSLGLPPNSGIIPTVIILIAAVYYGLNQAHKRGNILIQYAVMGFALGVIGFSTIGVVVVRANAHPSINMNAPTDPMRLIPYLNREQYGERPLLYGPHFKASPVSYDQSPRYGLVDGTYQIVDYKASPVYRGQDKMLFPRMGHNDSNRRRLYKNVWMNGKDGPPNMADNIGFFLKYQVSWMYWRYFMWNFAGRQNGEQGYYPQNKANGNWISGIKILDEARLHNMDEMTDHMKKHRAQNKYYLIPFILGIIGLIFHYRRKRRDFLALLALFFITGIGIIIYSNQPPNEPRERDYVLVGSFITFAIWIGMAVPAIASFLASKTSLKGMPLAIIPIVIGLAAPGIMLIENYDDHSRKDLKGARDYAHNFLESCQPEAIIFTYGDNDTYPLWYAQEVEGIRTDVRVINLSLIAVDWYINHQRRRQYDSPPIKFSIPENSYIGDQRNQLFIDPFKNNRENSLASVLKFAGEEHPLPTNSGRDMKSYIPAKKFFIPIDKQRAIESGWVDASERDKIVSRIEFDFGDKPWITKDYLAVLDIIQSNIYDRPIYFSTTILPERLMNLNDYCQIEGLAMQLVPIKTRSPNPKYIFYSGRVDLERSYDLFLNEFEWGNFDKKEMFVEGSFAATQQSHRMVMMRTANELLQRGQTQKAIDVAGQYFEAFPEFNFAYDQTVEPFIEVFVQGKATDLAKEHLALYAEETAQRLKFYNSLSPSVLKGGSGFQQAQNAAKNGANAILRMSRQLDDDAFANEINQKLAPFISGNN